MPKPFGFPKSERLKSRKQIDALFSGGKSVSVFPVRAVYKFFSAEGPEVKVGVSASKRSFKRAVDRNRIKRLLREAWRLQKEELMLKTKEAGAGATIFFLYNGKELPDFQTLKTAVGGCLHRLTKNLQRENAS